MKESNQHLKESPETHAEEDEDLGIDLNRLDSVKASAL